MPYETSIERLGRQKGRQEGRQEEAGSLVVRLARKRFPLLSVETESAIRQLAVEQLESLSEALLDFAALEDLERWLRDHSQKA